MIFCYTVDPSADEPVVLLNKHIGYDPDDGFGIMGDQFEAELLALDAMGKKRIQVWINSPGGDVQQGFSMYNAMLKTKTPVDTYCCGIAASMAGVLFQAGRKRSMADYSILMYHNPFGVDANNKQLDAYKQSLVNMVTTRSGMSEDDCRKMMNRESWIGADEAYDMKLCDVVESSADFNKKHWTQVSNSQDLKTNWKAANKVLNQIFIKNTDMALPKVANKLGLIADANEDSIVVAVEKVQNRAEVAEKRITELEAEKAEAEKKVADIQNKLNTLQTEKDAADAEKKKAEEEKAAAETEARKTKATALVNNYVKLGRIKNDAKLIEKWVKQATEDHDGTKEMLDGVPVNAKAAKIENAVGADTAVATPKGNFAARAMAKVQDKLK